MMQELAIIGLGKMGSALVQGLLPQGLQKEKSFRLHIYEQDQNYLAQLRNEHTNLSDPNVIFYSTLDELLKNKVATLLAVKPNTIASVCQNIRDERLIISIAAGISVATIEASRAKQGAIIRVMPNTPFMIGQGISALFANGLCRASDKDLAETIFHSGGKLLWVKDENLMHTVTALSGSGPAYAFLFLQALEDAGVLCGLDRISSRQLAQQTILGATMLAQSSNQSPQDLIHQVTSPGGTTIAALSQLKKESFEAAVTKAVEAACERSKQLG